MMLNTIEECNRVLAKIDSEMDRLKLERKHVMEVRRFLGETAVPEYVDRTLTSPEKIAIVDFIRENPGITGKAIINKFAENGNRRIITQRLSDLRRGRWIENRGTAGMGARWYVKENDATETG